MSTHETAWESGETAAVALAPEAGMFASADAAGLGESTLAVFRRAAGQPAAAASATLRFCNSMAMIGPVAAARWLGIEAKPPVPVPDGDRRFADKTWTENPAFFAIRQMYLAGSRLVNEMVELGSGSALDDAKAQLATGFLLDALAPTNFLPTNPAALKRALETGGTSVRGRRAATSSATCSATTAARVRSTSGRSSSARTSPPPPARSSSGTT